MAQWFLTNEAAPRANKLLDIFAGAKGAAGARSGGMVSRQQNGLKADGAATLAETNFLTTLLWILMGVGIGVAATVVYLTNRSIVPPIALAEIEDAIRRNSGIIGENLLALEPGDDNSDGDDDGSGEAPVAAKGKKGS